MEATGFDPYLVMSKLGAYFLPRFGGRGTLFGVACAVVDVDDVISCPPEW